MSRLVLVTGAAGYIGSHCVLHLLTNNWEVIAIDNCSNSVLTDGQHLPESLKRVEILAEKKIKKFIFGDLKNLKTMNDIFSENSFEAVIHLATLKSITESISEPLDYYSNNIIGTLNLLDVMKKYSVYNLLFASSASVYGKAKYLPIDELHPTGQSCTNPYARSNVMIEQILQDICASDSNWTVVSMRIFNTIGAHSSGDIGEDPPRVPKNLLSYITQVAIDRRPELRVFGNDYDTIDGTCIRDYIHIEDLCDAFIIILDKMLSEKWSHWYSFNIGSGCGHSVLEVISKLVKNF
jgi:UDP-glucose 4-epimerase